MFRLGWTRILTFPRNLHPNTFLRCLKMDNTAADIAKCQDEPKGDGGENLVSVKRTGLEVSGPEAKKVKRDENIEENKAANDRHSGLPFRKKKVALLMMYSGKGYTGMQKNPGVHTVEDDLLSALVKAGVVTEDHASVPGKKMDFQRAARTDKGVSAVGQLCSLKMFIDVENPVEKINSHLPPQVRVLGIHKATKGFNSKNTCCGRSYFYLLPTFAFAPLEEKVTEDYRITSKSHFIKLVEQFVGEILEKVNSILEIFKGTHNFHNFSSGRKANDPSAKRFIINFQCGAPFVQDGLELVEITIRGQSFILHQIRKMIGLTIAIVRGFTTTECIEKSWGPKKVDVPRAPGLGLVLDKTHYDYYNRKFGKDGIHEAIDWDKYKKEIDAFKENFIFREIIETEKNEKSMMEWLATLPVHSFDVIPDELLNTPHPRTAYGAARQNLYEHNIAEEQVKSSEASDEASKSAGESPQKEESETSPPVDEPGLQDKADAAAASS